MNKAHSARRDPIEALALEVAGYRTLLEILRAEQEALRAADPDALAQIAEAKLAQIYTLQDLDAARTRALREEGFDATAAGVRALLARCAQPDRARAQWAALASIASDAQRQNALNTRLADVQQRHVDRAMAALWDAAGCASTYGADGRSKHRVSPRSLAAI